MYEFLCVIGLGQIWLSTLMTSVYGACGVVYRLGSSSNASLLGLVHAVR
jgi:hypothetical protein